MKRFLPGIIKKGKGMRIALLAPFFVFCLNTSWANTITKIAKGSCIIAVGVKESQPNTYIQNSSSHLPLNASYSKYCLSQYSIGCIPLKGKYISNNPALSADFK